MELGEDGGRKVARRVEPRGQSGRGMVTAYSVFEISSVFLCDSGEEQTVIAYVSLKAGFGLDEVRNYFIWLI